MENINKSEYMEQIKKELIKTEKLNLEDLKVYTDTSFCPEYIETKEYIKNTVECYFTKELDINYNEIKDLQLIYDLYRHDFYFYFKSGYINLNNFKTLDPDEFKKKIFEKIKEYKPKLTTADKKNINYILDDVKIYTTYSRDCIIYSIDADYICETTDVNLNETKTEKLETEIYNICESFEKEIREYMQNLNNTLLKKAIKEYEYLETEEHKRHIFNQWKKVNNIFPDDIEFFDLNIYADTENFNPDECLFIGETEYIKFYIDLKYLKNIKKHIYKTTYIETEYKEIENK